METKWYQTFVSEPPNHFICFSIGPAYICLLNPALKRGQREFQMALSFYLWLGPHLPVESKAWNVT